MFNWFKESTDDKYIRALSDAEGEWSISKSMHITRVELRTAHETFAFVEEDFWFFKNFYEHIQDTKRKISKKLFQRVYKIAEESVSNAQIQKVGGYILDEDLRQAISDAKHIMGAHSQLEVLHNQIETIRAKYK